MRHPFQIGDLVRSKINATNLALITKAYKKDGEFYVDALWFRTGKEVKWYCISRFQLVSRGAE